MPAYWAEALAEEISQGDLLDGAWIGTSASPRVGLKKAPTKSKGGVSWDESVWTSDANNLGHFLARGRKVHALVLSQSCEIDKKGGVLPVLLAPIFPLSVIQSEEIRQKTRMGERFAFLYLDPIEGVIEESYVDLRAITYVPRAVVDQCTRKASAGVDGTDRLSAQLVAFFTRISMDSIVTK